MDRIECSIHKLRSELQAKRREAQKYKEAVMRFMASFSEGSSKCAYNDSPLGRSYTVSKFHMLRLCSFGFKTDISLIYSSPQIKRPRMTMVRTLMLAMVRTLMLVMMMITPPCHCTIFIGT